MNRSSCGDLQSPPLGRLIESVTRKSNLVTCLFFGSANLVERLDLALQLRRLGRVHLEALDKALFPSQHGLLIGEATRVGLERIQSNSGGEMTKAPISLQDLRR